MSCSTHKEPCSIYYHTNHMISPPCLTQHHSNNKKKYCILNVAPLRFLSPTDVIFSLTWCLSVRYFFKKLFESCYQYQHLTKTFVCVCPLSFSDPTSLPSERSTKATTELFLLLISKLHVVQNICDDKTETSVKPLLGLLGTGLSQALILTSESHRQPFCPVCVHVGYNNFLFCVIDVWDTKYSIQFTKSKGDISRRTTTCITITSHAKGKLYNWGLGDSAHCVPIGNGA